MRRVAVLTMILIGACSSAGDDPGPVTRVETMTLLPARISTTLEFSAVLEPVSEAYLVSPGGVVTEITVSEGERVRQGQPLLRLSGDRAVRSGSVAALASLRAAVAQAERAESDLERTRELYVAGAVSERTLNASEAAAQAASAYLTGAESARSASVAGEAAGIVTAPFDGVAGMVRVSVGSLTSPGEVVTSVSGDGLVARLLVPERHLMEIRPGMDAEFTPFLQEMAAISGSVERVARSVDPVTGLVALTVVFRCQEGPPPGVNGTLSVETAGSDSAIVIPSRIVRLDQGRLTVPVLVEGTVEYRQVATGIESGDSIQVLEGLSFHEEVIVGFQGFIGPGTRAVRSSP